MMHTVLWDLRCSWKQHKMIKLDLIKTIVKSNDGQKEKQTEYSEFPIVLRWLYRNKSCRRWPYQTFTDREKVAALVPLLHLGCAVSTQPHLYPVPWDLENLYPLLTVVLPAVWPQEISSTSWEIRKWNARSYQNCTEEKYIVNVTSVTSWRKI